MNYSVTYTYNHPINTNHYWSEEIRNYIKMAKDDGRVITILNKNTITDTNDPTRAITTVETVWASQQDYDRYVVWYRNSGEYEKRTEWNNANDVEQLSIVKNEI